jgi:hypothetical protein
MNLINKYIYKHNNICYDEYRLRNTPVLYFISKETIHIKKESKANQKLNSDIQAILSLCWGENDERRCTSFIVDGKHEYTTRDGLSFKPTNNTYEELVKYQEDDNNRPIKLYRNGDFVNITGGAIIK